VIPCLGLGFMCYCKNSNQQLISNNNTLASTCEKHVIRMLGRLSV